MKRILLTCIFLFVFVPIIFAWDIATPVGSKTNSIGNCSVALSEFWSCHNNPAGFADYNNIAVGLSYENRFLLKELAYKNIGVIIPFNIGVIGITASQFGYNRYNENLIGLGLSRSFGPNLKIGLKLDYIFLKHSIDYAKIQTVTFELGIQYHINKSLCLGAYIFNPINVKLKTFNKERIPIIMRIGLSYFVKEDFLITAEIEENFENNFSYRFGLEYEIYKKLLNISNKFVGIEFNEVKHIFKDVLIEASLKENKNNVVEIIELDDQYFDNDEHVSTAFKLI